jgi:hypothetical protein
MVTRKTDFETGIKTAVREVHVRIWTGPTVFTALSSLLKQTSGCPEAFKIHIHPQVSTKFPLHSSLHIFCGLKIDTITNYEPIEGREKSEETIRCTCKDCVRSE